MDPCFSFKANLLVFIGLKDRRRKLEERASTPLGRLEGRSWKLEDRIQKLEAGA